MKKLIGFTNMHFWICQYLSSRFETWSKKQNILLEFDILKLGMTARIIKARICVIF